MPLLSLGQWASDNTIHYMSRALTEKEVFLARGLPPLPLQISFNIYKHRMKSVCMSLKLTRISIAKWKGDFQNEETRKPLKRYSLFLSLAWTVCYRMQIQACVGMKASLLSKLHLLSSASYTVQLMFGLHYLNNCFYNRSQSLFLWKNSIFIYYFKRELTRSFLNPQSNEYCLGTKWVSCSQLTYQAYGLVGLPFHALKLVAPLLFAL
jgi:hypothetical protein